ncbi:hypothetical protein Scep_015306 [Stephania cephalantha]|uniref:BTB/POZ domain-containing protein FBL11 n=1 Tax=Stephania cephalantha TaxID=152367 RepID=A0AAP0P2P2_9MAGN
MESKDVVILVLSDPSEDESDIPDSEMSLSMDEISEWNIPAILRCRSINVSANRDRLSSQSSFFRGLLSGSCRESYQDRVTIRWNLEIVVEVLRFICGCRLEINVDNFLPLMEGAVYFGVTALLMECKSWFHETTTHKSISTPQIPFNAIVETWSFAVENGYMCAVSSFVPELSCGYIARNFVVRVCVTQMWASSCSSFVGIPYNLLRDCLANPHLTVDSEKNLAEALIHWLDCNRKIGCASTTSRDDYGDILKEVRINLLPLGFVIGKKRCRHFSKLACGSIDVISSVLRDPSTGLMRLSGDIIFDSIKIRLTEYTKRIDLSGCPQITSACLIFSVLPCLHDMDHNLKKRIKQSLVEIERFDQNPFSISQELFPTLLFQSVHEVDLSKCPLLHLETAIKFFCKSFPFLRTMKASYCLNFRMKSLLYLIKNCPLVDEVDLTADISPVVPMQVSVISTHSDVYEDMNSASDIVSKVRSLSSHIRKLTLAGQSDIEDSDLFIISLLSHSLTYLNIAGCTSATDTGISKLICNCMNLQSLVVSDTYFGRNSILTLCSDLHSPENFHGVHREHGHSTLLASRLQELDIGGCMSVDVASLKHLMSHICMIRNLCVRGTVLVDDVLFSFSGSSLEMLDISDTMVSSAAVTYVIKRNADLRCFKSIGCRNLCRTDLSNGCMRAEQMYVEMGEICNLEDVAFGWGFSSLSLIGLGSAMRSLRAMRVGLGASLNECVLMELSSTCPLLEQLVLKFQIISDDIVKSVVESLRNLQVLGICCCLGELSSLSIFSGATNLRKLSLLRMTPWMTNDDLVVLTQNCTGLIELQLSGCNLLNSDSQKIISRGWPGLISLDLEDCGEVTSKGINALFECKAIEVLTLRHNGRGIPKSFIIDVASKMPMLRKLALDLCDANEGGFESPSYEQKFFLRTVTIAKCKQEMCAFNFGRLAHKENVVLEWYSKWHRTTIVKERL